MNEYTATEIPADDPQAEAALARQRAAEADLLAAEERQQERMRAEGATEMPIDDMRDQD